MGGAFRFSPKTCLASGEPNLQWMSGSDVPWRTLAADEDGAVPCSGTPR